jgi:hypothetical protein
LVASLDFTSYSLRNEQHNYVPLKIKQIEDELKQRNDHIFYNIFSTYKGGNSNYFHNKFEKTLQGELDNVLKQEEML